MSRTTLVPASISRRPAVAAGAGRGPFTIAKYSNGVGMLDGIHNVVFADGKLNTMDRKQFVFRAKVTHPGYVITSASKSVTMKPSSAAAKSLSISGGSSSLVANFSHASGSGTLTQAAVTSTSVTTRVPTIGTRAGTLNGRYIKDDDGGGPCRGKTCPQGVHPEASNGCNSGTRSLAIAGAGLVVAAIAAGTEAGVDPLADAAFLAAWWAYNDAYNTWQDNCNNSYNVGGGGGDGDDSFDQFLEC